MLKHLIIIFSISLVAVAACAKSQPEANAPNNSAGASGSSEATNSSVANKDSSQKTSSSSVNANTKTFLGDLDNKRVQINLTRQGNNLSGTYQYEKVGKDLKLAGTIDGSGNFTLQETDPGGNKTGEWRGTWKEDDGKAVLTGKWKNPKGGDDLTFSANELLTEFTGGAKITTKSSNEENKAKLWEVTAEYPELSGVASAATFNQSVKKIVDDSSGEFKKNIADYTTPDDLKRYKEDNMSLYDATSYDLTMANDDLISVTFEDANYQGGAHGSSTTTTLNFDVKNNCVLKLADLFEPNSNYLKTLSDLSTADLKAKLQKDDNLQIEMLDDGASPKEENFRSWNLTKKGLLINFDPYQVASYAAGPQEVTIPYSKLQSILKKDSAVAKLAK